MTDIDTSIYRTAPAKSPMDQVNDIVSMQNNMQDLQQKKLNMAVGQQKYIANVLGSLYGKPDLSADDIIREGSKAVQMGIIPQQQFGTMLQGLPQDPAQLRQWVGSLALRAADASTQLEAHAGRAGAMNNGAYDVGTRTSIMDGSRTYAPGNAGAIPMQISPGQAMDRTQTVGPDGSQRSVPTAAVSAGEGTLTRGGNVNVPPPNMQPQNRLVGQPAPAQQPNKLGVTSPVRQTPVPPQINPNIPVQQAPDNPPPVPQNPYGGLPSAAGAGLQTGLAPGKAQAATVTADASAKQGAALQQAAEGAQNSKALLADMEKQVEGLSLGPMASKIRTGQSIVNQGASLMGKEPVFKSVQAQEQFVKQAEQLRQQQAQALGGTDATLASAGASSPNERYTTEGVKGMIATLKGNQDAILVKNKEWQAWKQKNGADSYGEFQQDFNSKFEPRVFALPYMAPEARRKMLSSLSPSEAAKVDQAYKIAVANGWMKRVGGN